MIIESLKVERFRHLKPFRYTFDPHFNLIIGKNASGKTSFLEALFFLSHLKSFRTHNSAEIIETDAESFILFAEIADLEEEQRSQLGIERTKKGFQIRKDFEPVQRRSELAKLLPILFIGPDTGQSLIDSPRYRRQFIDWGLFQSLPQYHGIWLRYERALKQRNAALKGNMPDGVLRGIEHEMAESGEILSEQRAAFLAELTEKALPLLHALLPELTEWEVRYQYGYSKGHFSEGMAESRPKDRIIGYTRSGPHRADFSIKVDGHTAHQYLSRGQIKLMTIAMMLAQITLYREKTGHSTILLMDDITAELDQTKRGLLLTHLIAQKTQLFVTCLEPNEFPELTEPSLKSSMQYYELTNGSAQKVV